MFLKRVVPYIVPILLLVIGCSREEVNRDPPDPDVVASFKGGVITKDQVNNKYESLMPCCKGRYNGEDGRRVLIKEMVLPTVISRAIKQQNIDVRANIREELGNLKDELNMAFLHIKFHEQILKNNEKYTDLSQTYNFQKKRLEGFPLSERYDRLVQIHQKIHPQIAEEVKKVSRDYIEKLRREASVTKNYEVLKVKFSRDELKDFYRKHKQGLHGDEYRVPEKVKIRQIKTEVEKDSRDCPTCAAEKERAAKEKATSALFELRSGASFSSVARNYTSQSSATLNSEWISRSSENSAYENAVFAIEEGEISQVLQKDGAFYIVKVLEKKPGRFKSFEEILEPLEREYRWQKGEIYLEDNRDAILFTIDSKPYTIGDYMKAYAQTTPEHQCHHMEKVDMQEHKTDDGQLCDLSHNTIEEQKNMADRMIDRELITEDTYNQMIHVEHQEEIEFLTMASLYPIFHREEMQKLIHITDEMVDDYYKNHENEYRYPAKAKLSMIVVRGGENEADRKTAYEKATRAYKELKPSWFSLKKKKDFAEVARKYSEDEETASRGGRLDVDVYECRNAIEYMVMHGFHNKIFALKPGDISDVFEFGDDYYIVQIREMESRKQLTFDEARERVKKDLMDHEHQKVMDNWEDDLLKSAGFVVYDQTLKELVAETEERPDIKGS
jgi:parvulin-like peptidyl-prolyl isomerase